MSGFWKETHKQKTLGLDSVLPFPLPCYSCCQQDPIFFTGTAFSGSQRPAGSLHLSSLTHQTCQRKDESQPNQFKTRRNRTPLVSSCWQEHQPAPSLFCSCRMNKSVMLGCQLQQGWTYRAPGETQGAILQKWGCGHGCFRKNQGETPQNGHYLIFWAKHCPHMPVQFVAS